MALIPQIQEEHSTLLIVHDDPERRQKPDVEDVQAKPPKPGTVAGFPAKDRRQPDQVGARAIPRWPAFWPKAGGQLTARSGHSRRSASEEAEFSVFTLADWS